MAAADEVPKQLSGQVEPHRGGFRAHMQIRVEGKKRHFCGPTQSSRERAEEDLHELREAKRKRIESNETLIEELLSVCERLSKKKAEEKAFADFENEKEAQQLITSAFETLDCNVVMELLERGFPIDQPAGVEFHRRNLLMQAARLGNDVVARRLLERRANVGACTPAGSTALHDACSKGHIEVVKVLLEWRADPAAETPDGFSPLDSAITFANKNVAEMRMMLLECGGSDREEDWARRRHADHCGAAYVDRARASSQPPPMPGL